MTYKNISEIEKKVVSQENVIIGSGAGGSTTAFELLKKNMDSLILEEGPAIEKNFNNNFRNIGTEISSLYKNNGATPIYSSNGGPLIGYGQGCCIGGSTYVNAGYFSNTPSWVFEEWIKKGKVNFSYNNFNNYINEIKNEINISTEELTSKDVDSKKLYDGCRKLNWQIEKCERFLSNCQRRNMCPIGCPSKAKQSMNVTYHKKLNANNINTIYNCKVEKIFTQGNKADYLIVRDRISGKTKKIKFKNLFVCCGPISTPHLLNKSKLIKYNKNQNDFEFHINFRIVVKFKGEKINSNLSTVSIFFVREFEKEGALLSSANSEIPYLLGTTSHYDLNIKRDLFENFQNYAIYIYQIKAKSKGQVRDFFGMPYVKYTFDQQDYFQIKKAILRISELFFNVGAEFVLFPIENIGKVHSIQEAQKVHDMINLKKLHLISVHGMSSLRSGPESSQFTDYFGRLKNFTNVFINDASILPGNTGESPQASIMSFVKHNVQNNRF